jgi:hypothetical protein
VIIIAIAVNIFETISYESFCKVTTIILDSQKKCRKMTENKTFNQYLVTIYIYKVSY